MQFGLILSIKFYFCFRQGGKIFWKYLGQWKKCLASLLALAVLLHRTVADSGGWDGSSSTSVLQKVWALLIPTVRDFYLSVPAVSKFKKN